MFEQTFKNIDDVLHKDDGCGSELDYVEQSSWVLFLKYLDDLEKALPRCVVLYSRATRKALPKALAEPDATTQKPLPKAQVDAIAAIKKLGGKVQLDRITGEVTTVDFGWGNTQITDAGLEHRLANFGSLLLLDLPSCSIFGVGDMGRSNAFLGATSPKGDRSLCSYLGGTSPKGDRSEKTCMGKTMRNRRVLHSPR